MAPRVKVEQIVWHSKEPVYSLDFHPDGTLFTAGADKEIKSWEVFDGEDGSASVKHISTLNGHNKTINCVRFSPSGNYLVSSADSGEMLLWQPQQPSEAPRGNLVDPEEASCGWRRVSMLSGHADDVMDLAWSPDGTALISGSIDNRVILWEVSQKKRGKMITSFDKHKHFVQGVAWDPAQQFLVSQSADRTCAIYALRPTGGKKNKVSQYMQPACDTASDFYCSNTLSKRVVAPPAAAADGAQPAKPEKQSLFLDESMASFFRRPSWSPDGAFLALPAGAHRATGQQKDQNTVYLYARGQWTNPIAHLPAQNKPVVAVRFCPVLFRKDSNATPPAPFEKLPYKMVFAIATTDSVIVHDTSSVLPLAVFGQLHYDSITEIGWSKDGKYLAVASRDGYCSIATFQAGDLGEVLAENDLPVIVKKWKTHNAAVAGAVQVSPKPAAVATAPPSAAPAVNAAAKSEVKEVQVKKRIAPQPIGAGGQPSQAAKEAPPAKKKRITPQAVVAEPIPSTKPAVPAESEKASKRITPTPLAAPSPAQAPAFESAKAATSAAPKSDEPPVADQSTRRRITPMPVAAAAAAPAQEETVAEAAPVAKPGGLAALAALMGNAAAKKQ